MGNSIEAKKQEQEENDAKAKEMLNTMNNLMTQKCAATSAQFKDAAVADPTLPIVAVVDKTEKYMLNVKSVANDDVTSGLGEVLSGQFITGLGDMISGSIQVFLGDTSEGQSEETDFHVVYANNSLLRVDYLMYKYNFSSQGILSKYENAFCYVMQIGVLDLEKVNPQILLYEMTKTIGQDNLKEAAADLDQLAQFAKELYSTIRDLNDAAKPDQNSQPEQPQIPEPSVDPGEDQDEDQQGDQEWNRSNETNSQHTN